jgi:hypothetical protein
MPAKTWTFRGRLADIELELYPGAVDAETQQQSLRHLSSLTQDFKYRDAEARRVVLEVYAQLEPSTPPLRAGDLFDFDLGSSRADRIMERLQRAARTCRLVAKSRTVRTLAVPVAEDREPVLGPESRAEPRPQRLFDPRWSVPRVAVGAEVLAIVSYADLRGPLNATLVVSEVDGPAGRQEVDRIRTSIPAGTGLHEVSWRRDPKEAQADLEQEEDSEGPVEYRFAVECPSASCAGESGPLWLTNTVTIDLVKDSDGKKHERSRTVVLRDAVGVETRARSHGGTVRFEKVLVGPVHLRMAAPRFSELTWSASQVPVGEPVEAVFAYEDAISGMKALVVVYEIDRGGSEREIDCLESSLAGVSGTARVSFTRTEDQAQQDIAVEEQEGDTNPLAYRFRVVADGEWSQASEPLSLTHTVSIRLHDTSTGSPLAHPAHLVLVAADGTEHRALMEGGRARFEDVICGPMTVKLERTATRVASWR